MARSRNSNRNSNHTRTRERNPRARCQAAGCSNFALPGAPVCAAHRGAEPDWDRAVADAFTASFAQRAERDESARRQSAAAAFRARLDAGDYRGLFGARLGELMAQAAAEGGVADELAALRIVMARLMAEEEDPVVLAKAVSRVAAVSIQAARAQRAISGQLAESLTDALTTILTELETGGEP